MKKVKYVAALCVALVLALSLALVGCNNLDKTGGLPGSKEITGDTDPSEIVTQKMTEETWTAAFDFSAYTNFSATNRISSTASDETDELRAELKIDGNN